MAAIFQVQREAGVPPADGNLHFRLRLHLVSAMCAKRAVQALAEYQQGTRPIQECMIEPPINRPWISPLAEISCDYSSVLASLISGLYAFSVLSWADTHP